MLRLSNKLLNVASEKILHVHRDYRRFRDVVDNDDGFVSDIRLCSLITFIISFSKNHLEGPTVILPSRSIAIRSSVDDNSSFRKLSRLPVLNSLF